MKTAKKEADTILPAMPGAWLAKLICIIAGALCSSLFAAPVWVVVRETRTVQYPAEDRTVWVDATISGTPRFIPGTPAIPAHETWEEVEEDVDIYEDTLAGPHQYIRTDRITYMKQVIVPEVPATEDRWEGGDPVPGHWETQHFEAYAVEEVFTWGYWDDDGT